MKTRKFHLDNWTGETAVISYTISARQFEANGETFTLGDFESMDGQLFAAHLFGVGWTGSLATVFFQTDFNTPTLMEAAVIAATRWAANHV